MKKPENLRTWIEIDKKAIAKNYRTLRKLVGGHTLMMAVVKSNAYGHNLHEFAPEMERLGADWLGVDSLVEAVALRKGGVKIPILVLGFTLPALYPLAQKNNISLTISSFAQLDAVCALKKSARPIHIHIKIDTGMHRQGFQIDEAQELLSRLASAPTKIFAVEGLYTHFAEAKNPRNNDATKRQIALFEEWRTRVYDAGFDPIVHAGATGGTLLYRNAHYDMVRVGIGCYGLWPSEEAKYHLQNVITLYPVLAWSAVVAEVKVVTKGERVGYDSTELLRRDTTIAVIPVGYWHGIPRLLSSKGRVLIHGKSAGILGRVSMDMIVVDVTDIPKVAMGDVATIIGKDKKEEITAREIAQYAATTAYEILTRLNPLIKRFYI
jgi:alanine racemase